MISDPATAFLCSLAIQTTSLGLLMVPRAGVASFLSCPRQRMILASSGWLRPIGLNFVFRCAASAMLFNVRLGTVFEMLGCLGEIPQCFGDRRAAGLGNGGFQILQPLRAGLDAFADQRPSLWREAVAQAKEADVAVVVAGISPRLEGEEMPVHIEGFSGGDRTSLDIPAPYEKLIEAIHATGTPVVLVLTGGSALAVNWADQHIPAIVMAWYPGEEGGNALADILVGTYNPAGRLPVTFYKSVDDLPPFTDYFMKGRTYRFFEGKPLYPFGYGLSYTTFDYKKITLSHPETGMHDTLEVRVTLRNSGSRDGEEVVQIYVHNPADKEGPRKALKGFRREMLKAGEEKEIIIPLAVQDLAVYHPATKVFAPDAGTWEIMAGASAEDIRLKTTLVVKQ